MSHLRVASFGISLDGYSAGPDQSLDHPLGVGGLEIMKWFFPTKTWTQMHGGKGGETGVDNTFAEHGMSRFGAWILGRHMFGPIRGPWPNEDWRGWWGDEPPYHCPVFVLTHHARPALEMRGGTTFHFVTEGIEAALAQARAACGSKDIRLGGGVATVRQYLQARLIDELHLAVAPVLLGRGEALFAGLDLPQLGYEVTKTTPGERATHVVITRKSI
jgi:dihydrofolate reductase